MRHLSGFLFIFMWVTIGTSIQSVPIVLIQQNAEGSTPCIPTEPGADSLNDVEIRTQETSPTEDLLSSSNETATAQFTESYIGKTPASIWTATAVLSVTEATDNANKFDCTDPELIGQSTETTAPVYIENKFNVSIFQNFNIWFQFFGEHVSTPSPIREEVRRFKSRRNQSKTGGCRRKENGKGQGPGSKREDKTEISVVSIAGNLTSTTLSSNIATVQTTTLIPTTVATKDQSNSQNQVNVLNSYGYQEPIESSVGPAMANQAGVIPSESVAREISAGTKNTRKNGDEESVITQKYLKDDSPSPLSNLKQRSESRRTPRHPVLDVPAYSDQVDDDNNALPQGTFEVSFFDMPGNRNVWERIWPFNNKKTTTTTLTSAGWTSTTVRPSTSSTPHKRATRISTTVNTFTPVFIFRDKEYNSNVDYD